MNKPQKDYENTIDRVDHMIRQNNKKYLDQKSQIQYEKALQQYEKHKQREIVKQFAQQIKDGNKKAISKKQKQLSVSNAKSRISGKSTVKPEQFEKQPQKPQLKPRQKLSQKQLKKVQKAVEARAERHLQEMQLEKLNKRLEQEKRRTKLYELTETCQKMLSKSHKRIPAVSEKIPTERRVLLEQFSRKAQEEVEELDNIISGLIKKSKGMKQQENKSVNDGGGVNDGKKNGGNGDLMERIFSEDFEIDFMNEMLSGNGGIDSQPNYWRSQTRQSPEDVLFTKPASELFQMGYIPIN